MIISTKSWHYRLMYYIWGKHYFSELVGFDFEHRERGNREDPTEIRKPKNISLCKYFWSLVFACWLFPWTVLVREFLMKLPDLPNWKLPPMSTRVSRGISAALLFTSGIVTTVISEVYIIGGFLFAMGFFMIFGEKILNWIGAHRKPKVWKPKPPKKKKEPSIMLEYVKARKKKVCPFLQFVDPEKEEVWK